MNKLLFFVLLFLLPSAVNGRGRWPTGELRITKKAGTEEFYLHYNYRGKDKVTRLYYGFDDSAFVTDAILLKDNDTFAARPAVDFGQLLVFAACDFNFSGKSILFFVDRAMNRCIAVKPGGYYLETGLPAFLVTTGRVVVACAQLPFMDAKTENARLSYYRIDDDAVTLWKQKTIKVTWQQATSKEALKEPRLQKQIFDDQRAEMLEQADNKMAAGKTVIDDLGYYGNPTFFDSVKVYNDRLATYISKVCTTLPATITANFTRAEEHGIDIHTSADKKLRCYTWNSRENGDGLARFVRNVVQFKTGHGMRAASGDGGDWVPAGLVVGIKTIHTRDNKTVYLVSVNLVDLPESQHFCLTAVVIENGRLKQYPLFKSGNKTLEQITYNHAAVPADVDADKKDPELHFSKDLQHLYVPVADKDSRLTGNYIVYNFDGSLFVRR